MLLWGWIFKTIFKSWFWRSRRTRALLMSIIVSILLSSCRHVTEHNHVQATNKKQIRLWGVHMKNVKLSWGVLVFHCCQRTIFVSTPTLYEDKLSSIQVMALRGLTRFNEHAGDSELFFFFLWNIGQKITGPLTTIKKNRFWYKYHSPQQIEAHKCRTRWRRHRISHNECAVK